MLNKSPQKKEKQTNNFAAQKNIIIVFVVQLTELQSSLLGDTPMLFYFYLSIR